MKKWINRLGVLLEVFLIIVMILLSASLFAQEPTTEANQPVNPLAEKVTRLKTRLDLDEIQTAKVREILEKEQAQAAKDRESFKTNAIKLFEVAYERRNDTNARIETLLNPDQEEEFLELKKMTRFDRELFELTEGLLLNDDQAFTVEGILIEHYNKIKEFMPEGMWGGGKPTDMTGRPAGMPRNSRFFGRMKGLMREMERKKNTQIKKILTDEQIKLFKQIQQDRSEKRKEWFKKMKEMRKNR